MKKSVLTLIAMAVFIGFSGIADAQRGGGGGGGSHGGGGGWSGGGGHGGGSWSGGGGGTGWHGGGGSGWHGNWNGGSGWHGGWNNGWRGGWNNGWHGGWNNGWRGGCWGCTGWNGGWGAGWWGGVAVAAPWWGWPWWGWSTWDAPAWGVTVPVAAPSAVWWGQDPVFVEQPAAPSAPASAPPVTWFYCTQPAGYYPYVQACSRPWVRVVPDAMQPPPAPASQQMAPQLG